MGDVIFECVPRASLGSGSIKKITYLISNGDQGWGWGYFLLNEKNNLNFLKSANPKIFFSSTFLDNF